MGKKNKRAGSKVEPATLKQAQTRAKDVPSDQEKPSWSFSILDFGGPWCFTELGVDHIPWLLTKLRSFESMTWAEIKSHEHHDLPLTSLNKPAIKRLEEIDQDDIDSVFSFRLEGAKRVVGIRGGGGTFKILWWDSGHKVTHWKGYT